MSQTLTVKTLKQEKFTVEIEPTSTIGAAKEIIAEKRGLQLAGMKLIHSGRILKDSVTVAECNLKETDFLVLMGKPKPPGEAKAATPAPATTAAPTPQATPAATTPAAEAPAAADSRTLPSWSRWASPATRLRPRCVPRSATRPVQWST